jgi:KDO2-lipid IV(A) lauroyltransferase
MKLRARASTLLHAAREIGAHYALRLLPVWAVSAIGAELGRRFGPRNRAADQRLRSNLRRLRPDIADPKEFEAAVRRFWENAGRCFAEFSALTRIWGSDRVTIEGLDHLLASRATGRPRICMFLHLANWEIVGPTFLELGEGGLQIYQPLQNRARLWLAERVRRRYADHLVATGPGSARRILKELTGGGGLSIAVDESIAGEVYAPSFGRALHLDGNLARVVRLARRTDALVFIAYAERLQGARFRVHVQPPLPIEFGTLTDDQVEAAIMDFDRAIEPVVLRHIDQWFMLDNLRLD